MFKVTERVYRTVDNRLVAHGDPEARFLAYAVGDEVTDAEARRVGLVAFATKTTKTTARPEDKASGGLTVNRASRKEQPSG